MFWGQNTSETFFAFCWQGTVEVIKVKTASLGLVKMKEH